VLNIKTGEVVWDLPNCENVFFAGQLAADLSSVEFEHRKIKLRKPDEEESDFEAEGSDEGEMTEKTKLVTEDEGSDDDKIPSDFDEDRLRALTKGIMVIKAVEEEVEPPKVEKEEKEEKKDESKEKKPDDKDADEKDKKEKDKKVLMKFFRAYFPQWRKKISKKRLFWETSIEVKIAPVSSSKEPATLLLDDDKAKTGPVAELKEENPVLITSDNECSILSLIIKGLKGE
jgi:hypothetical protein